MSKLIDTAKALKLYLQQCPGVGQSLLLAGFNIDTCYDEDQQGEKLGSSVILIAPRMIQPSALSRAGQTRDYTLSVFITIKVLQQDRTAIENAVSITEKILDRIESKEWVSFRPAGTAFMSAIVEFGLDASINEKGRYEAVILPTYKTAMGGY